MKIREVDLGIVKEKLGITYSKSSTLFQLWAPTRKDVKLLLFEKHNDVRRLTYPMYNSGDGVFKCEISGNLEGMYYTYLIEDMFEVSDPYSIACSINSKKSAIIDMRKTDPDGFRDYIKPKNDRRDAIIYEVHIKDFTADVSSGVGHRGKYLGFIDKEAAYKDMSTGINHLVELGVTHVHLMPVADYISVREESDQFFLSNNYNWGYDPELYNVPEGSFSINPYDPMNRITELKMLIMELHKAGISVVLDVVYNHTYRTLDSNFNTIVPNYYYRRFDDGTLSNGSGTGNELASERPMVSKFIIESLRYWVEEYRVDGFRFDLMALLDKETIYKAIEELRGIDENILIYGEPWVAAASPLKVDMRCTFGTQRGRGFAFFNPYYRDALKGDGNSMQRGFIQGEKKYKNSVETGIVGSINFDEHHTSFCKEADETINYYNSHDDLIASDKLKMWFGDVEQIAEMNKLLTSIIMTSQGIPFIHAGNEFVRNKKLVKNSYNSGLNINAIDWTFKEKYYDVFSYTRDIIKIRREYPHFRHMEKLQIKKKIKIITSLPDYMVGSAILSGNEILIVIHNTGWAESTVDMKDILSDLCKTFDVRINAVARRIFDGKGIKNELFIPTEKCRLDRIATTIFSVRAESADGI